MVHNPNGDLDEVAQAMNRAILAIESGEVTTATRTVELDGIAVRAGQIIGLHNDKLAVAGDNLRDVVEGLLRAMRAEQRELITFYSGESVQSADTNALIDHVRRLYQAQEVELVEGGQPHYHYIVSAE